MRKLINAVANTSLTALGSILLIGTSIVIGSCGIGLTALVLEPYIDSRIKCAVGIQHPDCNDYKQKIEDLTADHTRLKQRFSNLEAIEAAVDTITLFEHKPLKSSDFKLTIGTIYNAVTDGTSGYQSYFCYIKFGGLNFDRNLYLRNSNADIDVDTATLRKNNISAVAYASARKQCQPMLIGG